MTNPDVSTHLLIFTDLDGTLLSEETYDPGPALPLLKRCRERHIPVVFCSSKTAAEIIALREELGNPDPFICENGGAVYLPKGMFPAKNDWRREGGFEIIEVGTPVVKLRHALREAAAEVGAAVRGMGEMLVEEVCALTGLDAARAALARERRYDEPFVLEKGDATRLEKAIRRRGLDMTRGGRFFHILGGSDKGKAVEVLAELYRKISPDLTTAGIGDAENDLPMFRVVDHAFLVQKPSGMWVSLSPLPNLERVEGAGPAGWARAVSGLLKEFQ